MLQFKEGVELRVTKTINEILALIVPVYESFQTPCVVTSGTDGTHDEHSKHYLGQALDFRVSNVQPETLPLLVQACQKACGEQFFVLFEGDHIHVYGKQEISTVQDLLNVVRGSNERYDVIFIDHIGYFTRDSTK